MNILLLSVRPMFWPAIVLVKRAAREKAEGDGQAKRLATGTMAASWCSP